MIAAFIPRERERDNGLVHYRMLLYSGTFLVKMDTVIPTQA
jgi:hypothetical protein